MARKSPAGTLKRGLAKIGKLWKKQQFDRALAELEALIAARQDNAQLLVMRSQLIRLQEKEEGHPTLDDARNDLETAAALDEQSPIPLIELGYFHYVIDDDARAALPQFERATACCKRLLRESLLGQAGALEELGRTTEARECLIQALALFLGHDEEAGYPSDDEIINRLKNLQDPETSRAGVPRTTLTARQRSG
jgi:Flp pilus assembly protein TadD